VLPDVHAQDRDLAVADRAVLVRGRHDRERTALDDDPAPAAAELVDGRVVHLLLQVLDAAERLVDRVCEVALGLAAALRAHDLPEERVVGVAATVVADRFALVLGNAVEVAKDLLDRLVGPFRSFEGRVRLVDVGLVVLVVMDAHRLLVDVRLERGVVVGKTGNLVCHC
jgi:hypothetical protein